MKTKIFCKSCNYQSSSVDFSNLSCCPEDYHILTYLEHALANGTKFKKVDITRFFTNKKPKVRLLAVNLYFEHYGHDNSLNFTILDPFYRIRLFAIPHIKFSELKNMIDDENVNVKQAVLEEIMNRKVSYKKKITIFSNLGKCIVHSNLNIRLITAKLLHIFEGLKLPLMEQLLSKNDEEVVTKSICGLIVYGLEDEYAEVRKSTINSLFILTNKANIHKTFSYFVDSLNDESFDVRKSAIDCIEKLSSKFKILVDLETIQQICFLIKEESKEITKIIVSVLQNLKFKDIEILSEIIENIYRKLSREDILSILISIFRNNTEIIINNIDRFYKYSLFLEQQIVLTDNKYFCSLVLVSLCVFNKIPLKLDWNIKKHVGFIIQEISITKKNNLKNLNDFTKDCLIKYIESEGKLRNIERLFINKKHGPDFIQFAAYFIHFLSKYKNNRSLIRQINYLFANVNIKDQKFKKRKNIINFISDLDLETIKKVKNNVKLVKIPNFETGCPINLEFKIDTPFSNSLLVIENTENKRLTYEIQEILKVSFYDDHSSFFKYFLIIKDENDEFIISKVKTIERSKNVIKGK